MPCKPKPARPEDVRQLLASDLDTRVFWGLYPNTMHAICLAALDLPPHPRNSPCRLSGKATVTSDGHIMCDYINPEEQTHPGAHCGTIRQLQSYADYLTEELQLTDAMDLTLRQALDAWIQTSYEAQPTKFAPQSH